MTPDQLSNLKSAVSALDDEYWGGSDISVNVALNAVEDLLGEIRTAWPRRD
jgi:hypothetical protein